MANILHINNSVANKVYSINDVSSIILFLLRTQIFEYMQKIKMKFFYHVRIFNEKMVSLNIHFLFLWIAKTIISDKLDITYDKERYENSKQYFSRMWENDILEIPEDIVLKFSFNLITEAISLNLEYGKARKMKVSKACKFCRDCFTAHSAAGRF